MTTIMLARSVLFVGTFLFWKFWTDWKLSWLPFFCLFGWKFVLRKSFGENDDDSSTRAIWLIHMCAMTCQVTHVIEPYCTCDWVISHMWMSHITHVHESCHTCEWIMSHMWTSHITHVNESCHTCEWVMSRMWMSHVTHVHESYHTCEWVISHMWMSHITHVNESCRACAKKLHTWLIDSWIRHVRDLFTCASLTWAI